MKTCKHPTVRFWRYLPFDHTLSTHYGLQEQRVPGTPHTKIVSSAVGEFLEVFFPENATHKICAVCKRQLAWGPAPEPATVSIAAEQVAAEIMGGHARGVMTELHLDGWKDYWRDVEVVESLMSPTWWVGWLCAAIADDLRNDISELDDSHTATRCRAGCVACDAPMGAFCRTEFGYPCSGRVYSALRAANKAACSLRGSLRHVRDVLAGYPFERPAGATDQSTIEQALQIAQTALAPSRHHVP